GFFNDEKFNTVMGAGALGAVINDCSGDNFDHTDLNFIHGASSSIAQTGRRPINNNPVPSDTPGWGKELKQNSLKYFNRSLSVGAKVASMLQKNNYLILDATYKYENGK